MAADELRVTYVKDFRDAVHEILDAPPPSSASNLWHLGSVVFVDLKGRDLGRPRAEAPHCSLELITVVVPSLQQAYAFDVSALANRTPGELVCLAVLFMCPGLCKVFYDCRYDADALRVLLTPANAFFRIRNIVDVSAAVLVFKLLDEGAAFYTLHMVSVEKAFEEYAPSAAFSLAFKTDDPPLCERSPTLEIGLRDFKSRMQSRMNASRDLWTTRPFPAEVLMYSAVNPLMCMVIIMQLRDLWLSRSAPDVSSDASLLASRMANVADGSDFLRDTYAVHNLPYTTDARVPNGLLDVIRGTALSTCSTFPSTFPFAPAASESLPWYNGLHLEPVPDPDQYHHKGERKGEGPEDFPELSSPSEETASSAVSSSSSEAGG